MARIELKHVQRFKDRHGRIRHYFRKPGCKRVTLPGEPGSAEFMEAYSAAGTVKREVGADKTVPKSVGALLVEFYGSTDFAKLAPGTQHNYRLIYERWRALDGHLPVAAIKPKHVRLMLDRLKATPGAARNFRKRLSTLMDFAVERDWRESNPVREVKAPTTPGDGFRAWTDEDIAKFEQCHPAGSRARRALYLMLYTGQRRSDIPEMGRQHVRAGKIHVSQYKGRNAKRGPVRLAIPLHPKLKAELDLAPKDDMTYLLTAFGEPFTHAGLSNWFVDMAKKAGLPPRSSPHGLRKAASRCLAEAGCTTKQIAAVTGHRTLKEVEHYTESADQERLAEDAMAAWEDRA